MELTSHLKPQRRQVRLLNLVVSFCAGREARFGVWCLAFVPLKFEGRGCYDLNYAELNEEWDELAGLCITYIPSTASMK